MDNLDEEAKKIIEAYPVFEPGERGKLRCTITGHELLARAELLDSYTKTAKFIRAFRINEIMELYGEYFDDLGNDKFGCKITKKILAKDPDDLKRHIEGRKFKAALERTEYDDGEHETSGDDSDISMDEPFPQRQEDNTFDDDEEEEIEEEYPEFSMKKDVDVSDDDNYDFSVMDTEEDADFNKRKRKAENMSKHKKRKRK